eukprot:12733476-Alexandrium_andersonii.AAC.1
MQALIEAKPRKGNYKALELSAASSDLFASLRVLFREPFGALHLRCPTVPLRGLSVQNGAFFGREATFCTE